MGKNFKGLMSIAHKAGIRPEAEDDCYLVFINSATTKFKILVGNKYLVYHDNNSRKIALDAIRFLPEAFKGQAFSFDAALRKSIESKINPSITGGK